jgi:putative peptide zinc metalloprotease protein
VSVLSTPTAHSGGSATASATPAAAAGVVAEPPGGPVPARATGVELIGEIPGSGYRRAPALARRPDGQMVQLTPLLYLILAAIDGRRGYDEIAARVSPVLNRLVSADNVRTLVEQKLRPLGLLRLPDGSEPQVRRTEPLLGLRFRFVVSDPRVTGRLTAPFARLFHPFAVAAVLLAFAAVVGWVLLDKGLASATYQAFDQPGLLLLVLGVTVVSAGFHEFGHAAAARYGGATPGAMGVGLYLVWPAFYTDVTDSYRLGRGGRLRTDLGGLYFNAIVAVAVYGAWWLTGWDALLLVIATQLLQMVRQLTPLVRFDGYHVLADLTGVPDLFHRIRPTLLDLLPHRWGKPETAESTALKPWARAVVTAWVLAVVPLLLGCLALMVVALPRILATGWASLGRQWAVLDADFARGDFFGVTAAGLSAVGIALPLLGIVYLLARVGRRVTGKVWRATSGRPVHRAAAGVAAAAVVAALAWAWWPDADRYRPIQPYERGTLLDGVPAAFQPGGTPAGLAEGRGGTAPNSIWAGGSGSALPTADKPQLALVLVPRSPDPATPTWVFPFDRPPAPGEGDNQALAVNTTDGSTVYDVAFALVWADGETALNRNEAYALANCQNCTTVAIAFQVVLVVGEVDLVPQNIAVAVNYSCIECLTVALAVQLVVTLPEPLSDQAMAELARLWEQVVLFGGNLEGMSLQQIHDQLERFQDGILQIVQNDLAHEERRLAPAPPSEAGPDPAGSTGPTGPITGNDSPPATSPADPGASEPTTSPAEPGPTGPTGPTTEPPPTGTSEPPPTSTADPAPTTAP